MAKKYPELQALPEKRQADIKSILHNPAIKPLPNETKAAMALLIARFGVDTNMTNIFTGKDAKDIARLTDNPPQDLYDSPSIGLTPKRLAELEERKRVAEASPEVMANMPGHIAIPTAGGGVRWVPVGADGRPLRKKRAA